MPRRSDTRRPAGNRDAGRYGAHDIERTEGNWQAGDWKDFDPRMPSPPNRGVPTESVVSKLTAEGHQGR